MTALFFIVLLAIAGSAYDYASIVADEQRLQYAVDAASLAGSDALANNIIQPTSTSPVNIAHAQATQLTIAKATAEAYLALNGYTTQTPGTTITFAFPTSTPVGSGTPSTVLENLSLTVDRRHQTYFWPLVGINSVNLHGAGSATSTRGLVDIMLSLDTTGSMELSGTSDFQQLVDAVVAFINQVNPTTTDARGPKLGIARFAGIKCSWNRGYTTTTTSTFTTTSLSTTVVTTTFRRTTRTITSTITTSTTSTFVTGGGDGDSNIDIGGTSEYVPPCTNDDTVLIPLTNNKDDLIRVADGSGSGVCSIGTGLACPLKHIDYGTMSNPVPVVSGTSTTPQNLQNGSSTVLSGPPVPLYTGTKLPNAIDVLNLGNTAQYSFGDAQGGRNDNPAGTGTAKKILVMMTDGFNEAWPDTGNPEDPSSYDSQFTTAAANLELGPDGISGTSDDVEIYVIGFFCVPYNGSSTSVPTKWCKSRQAGMAAGARCPTVYQPSNMSTIDTLLNTAASSTSGTCDHYFPIGKTENLPSLFQAIAGKIARGRLTS